MHMRPGVYLNEFRVIKPVDAREWQPPDEASLGSTADYRPCQPA